MHFDHYPMSPCQDGRKSHGRYQLPLPCRMAWIKDDREMGHFPRQGNDGKIRRVPGRGLEGAYAPLAKHHIRIAAEQNVLCRSEPFLDRCREPTLQDDRPSYFANLGQEVEVLHVARADLEDID